MTQNDLDKLKILANNDEDYLDALLIKLRNNAIKNGHDMSQFIGADILYALAGPGNNYTAHCKKCMYDIQIETVNTNSGIKIYHNSSDTKCNK